MSATFIRSWRTFCNFLRFDAPFFAMGRASVKQKVVSATSALGPKSSMVPPAASPGDSSSRRGTRAQNSGARAVGDALPQGASGTSRKRGLDASLAEVPLGPVDSAIGDGDPMDLVESSSGVEAALAAIDEQEALCTPLPVAAHTTKPCTRPMPPGLGILGRVTFRPAG